MIWALILAKLKAALFDAIIAYMALNNFTQQQSYDLMGVQRCRVGDVCRGNIAGLLLCSDYNDGSYRTARATNKVKQLPEALNLNQVVEK